jgi:hypothetical protein
MAKLESLRRGGASIRRIASELDLSTTTVARLVRALISGSWVRGAIPESRCCSRQLGHRQSFQSSSQKSVGINPSLALKGCECRAARPISLTGFLHVGSHMTTLTSPVSRRLCPRGHIPSISSAIMPPLARMAHRDPESSRQTSLIDLW